MIGRFAKFRQALIPDGLQSWLRDLLYCADAAVHLSIVVNVDPTADKWAFVVVCTLLSDKPGENDYGTRPECFAYCELKLLRGTSI